MQVLEAKGSLNYDIAGFARSRFPRSWPNFARRTTPRIVAVVNHFQNQPFRPLALSCLLTPV